MAGNTYTVQGGDSWFSISGKLFDGNQRLSEQIRVANPGIDMLRPGMVINIPDVDLEAANQSAGSGLAVSADFIAQSIRDQIDINQELGRPDPRVSGPFADQISEFAGQIEAGNFGFGDVQDRLFGAIGFTPGVAGGPAGPAGRTMFGGQGGAGRFGDTPGQSAAGQSADAARLAAQAAAQGILPPAQAAEAARLTAQGIAAGGAAGQAPAGPGGGVQGAPTGGGTLAPPATPGRRDPFTTPNVGGITGASATERQRFRDFQPPTMPPPTTEAFENFEVDFLGNPLGSIVPAIVQATRGFEDAAADAAQRGRFGGQGGAGRFGEAIPQAEIDEANAIAASERAAANLDLDPTQSEAFGESVIGFAETEGIPVSQAEQELTEARAIWDADGEATVFLGSWLEEAGLDFSDLSEGWQGTPMTGVADTIWRFEEQPGVTMGSEGQFGDVDPFFSPRFFSIGESGVAPASDRVGFTGGGHRGETVHQSTFPQRFNWNIGLG